MRFKVNVDGKKVGRRIKGRIEDGVDKAADDIARGIERRAKTEIRREGAVWRHHLIEGLEDTTVTFGSRTAISVRNVSGHAEAQEYGVSGTQVKRDTHLSYTDKKPPITALIPWVRSHLMMSGAGPRSDDFNGGDGGSGGTTVDETDDSIETDSNGLYVPGTNFREYDITEPFDANTTFPYQRVVVYDTFDKKYRRGRVTGYPDDTDTRVRVQFDDTDAITEIETNNASGFRLAGSEYWDSLTESEQKDVLYDHFENNIRDAYKTHKKTQRYLNTKYFREPTDDRLDWTRDKWLNTLWDTYPDKWYVKEQFRNFSSQIGMEQSYMDTGATGAIAPNSDNSRFSLLLMSKTQVSNKNGFPESEYIGTLHHESLHALTTSNRYKSDGSGIDWEKTLEKADWSSQGQNSVSGPDLPDHATDQMFKDNTITDPAPVGGDDWLPDAWDAAMNGSEGIHNYTPDFNTPVDYKFERLLEAANRAYWLQAVLGAEREQNGGAAKYGRYFTEWKYSSMNAEETLATFHEAMTNDTISKADLRKLLSEADYHYPWLIEAWLALLDVNGDQKDILADLGYNV